MKAFLDYLTDMATVVDLIRYSYDFQLKINALGRPYILLNSTKHICQISNRHLRNNSGKYVYHYYSKYFIIEIIQSINYRSNLLPLLNKWRFI